MQFRLRTVCLGSILPMLVVVLWEGAVRGGFWPSTIIAPPSQVLPAFGRLLANGSIPKHCCISLGRLLMGYGLGVIVGVFLGCLVGLSRIANTLLTPTLRFVGPIPALAWIPVLIVTFGIDGARVVLIMIGTALILYSATLSALRGTRYEYIELGRAYEKTPTQILLWIMLPSGAWEILSGCRVAAALAWVLLLASELIASSSGLGWLIWDSRNFSRADEMIVGMIVVGILGYLTDLLFAKLQEQTANWRKTFQGF